MHSADHLVVLVAVLQTKVSSLDKIKMIQHSIQHVASFRVFLEQEMTTLRPFPTFNSLDREYATNKQGTNARHDCNNATFSD